MLPRNSTRLALALLAGSALALAGGAVAQENPGASAGLTLPDNPQIFVKNDPNHRKATVVINGEVVTGTDVDQRMALIIAASGGKISDEERQRLRLQVLRNLMDETLQIQEARAQKIEIDDSEVDQTYARVARQNFGQDTKAMDGYLARIGSSPNSLKRQIRGELAWQRLLRRNVQPFVNVSDEEVREVMKRMSEAKGTDEFRVGEIFLSATSENQAAVLENAKRIVEQLRQGGSFAGYARQYSEASTAAVGGDLGWVRAGLLPSELAATVQGMTPGQLAGPVEVRGGYSIVVLTDRRQVLTADPRDALLSLKQISITFPAGISETDATNRAKQFSDAMTEARGCITADEVAAKIGAEVVTNEQIKARDLPGPLQALVLNLSLGETTPPFGSIQDGVRVLMLCSRDDPRPDAGPTFDDIQTQLEDERVNKRAQTYLRDLRRDAIIDYD
ncbi:MAG: peptidylprolyl isomerase [Novosphingobium sp.]|nr:peptidylprolyl isomerase [Novosphingobium sp.]